MWTLTGTDARGTVAPHLQHLPEPARDWKDPILAVLRVFGAEDDLPPCKRYVAPLQGEQLALSTAGLKGSDDQRLKVRFCRIVDVDSDVRAASPRTLFHESAGQQVPHGVGLDRLTSEASGGHHAQQPEFLHER